MQPRTQRGALAKRPAVRDLDTPLAATICRAQGDNRPVCGTEPHHGSVLRWKRMDTDADGMSGRVMAEDQSTRSQECHPEPDRPALGRPWEHRRRLPVFVLLMLVLLLAATNPTQDDFLSYIMNVPDGLTPTEALGPYIERAAAQLVRRSDLGIVSFYAVRMNETANHVWIGLVKSFVPWPAGWPSPGL